MKLHHIISGALLLVTGIFTVSCDNDNAIEEQSVITGSMTGGPTVQNDFDRWLEENYLLPYNIRFKYRYEEIESDFDYYTIPAEYWQAVQMAHIVKYICLDSYNEVAGADFTRQNFPKEFYCIGEWQYKNNGVHTLATAAGGKKILLAGVNYIDTYKNDIQELTYNYLKTIHHEFMHIMNQTKDIPTAFKFITGTSYVSSSWSEFPYETGYLARGFITAYAQEEYTEDFAEMMAYYICYSPEQWEKWMTMEHYYGYNKTDLSRSEVCLTDASKANYEFEEGKEVTSTVSGASATYVLTRKVKADRESIESKLLIVRDYMKSQWNIDIDQLRDCILRREAELAAGKIDLKDLTLK